jgi:hypothetical protein
MGAAILEIHEVLVGTTKPYNSNMHAVKGLCDMCEQGGGGGLKKGHYGMHERVFGLIFIFNFFVPLYVINWDLDTCGTLHLSFY